MKLRALLLTGGTLLLAGCSSTTPGSTGPSATSTTSPSAATAPTSSVAAQATSVTLQATVPPAVTTGDAYSRGSADLKNGNYKAAADAFRASIKSKQKVAASYAGLGSAYSHLGQFPVAFQGYRNAAQLDPANPTYQYEAAYSALYSQDYHAAITYAGHFINLEPRNPEGYHIRFLANGSLLNPKAQVRDAETVTKLSPHKADAFNDLGIALANVNKNAAAASAFSKAIALAPSNINYYINRALAENLNKQPKLALADMEQARGMTHDAATIKKLDGAIGVLKKEAH